MKRLIIAFAASAVMTTSAMAQTIGVSMASFDDQFLTLLREAIGARAKEAGIDIQFEDAQFDIGRQLSQVQNFVSQKTDAIIVVPADPAATTRMTRLAAEAGIPLVYANNKPDEELPEGVVYVGSEEIVAGRLQGEEIARQLNGKGNVAIMMGGLGHSATTLRTQGVEEVLAQHPELKIVEKQTANWQRTTAIDLMNNWLVSGVKMDAVVANNDEMAIGAIMALLQAGFDPKSLVIAGVDATRDALAEMERGNLDITVFQDAKAQGQAAVDSALKLMKGEKVESPVWVPFQLVTQDNYKEFTGK
ncbi:MAG: sugar ABC transporter substrate-binding protein [Pseudomonadota bacterium]|nr:sugar ABC transporter substrate-binding protein [Pseudomonadota bacterium]